MGGARSRGSESLAGGVSALGGGGRGRGAPSPWHSVRAALCTPLLVCLLRCACPPCSPPLWLGCVLARSLCAQTWFWIPRLPQLLVFFSSTPSVWPWHLVGLCPAAPWGPRRHLTRLTPLCRVDAQTASAAGPAPRCGHHCASASNSALSTQHAPSHWIPVCHCF